VERYPETEADRFCCDPIRGRVTITLETGSRNLPSNSDRTKAIRFGFALPLAFGAKCGLTKAGIDVENASQSSPINTPVIATQLPICLIAK